VSDQDGLKIERWPTSKLVPDPDNLRKHSDRNIEAIADSLRLSGQQKPIVITPEGMVVAGNGFLQAAKRLGWDEVDCVVTTLTGAKLRAFSLMDNRTSDLSEFNGVDLVAAIKVLESESDISPHMLGFNDVEVRQLVRLAEAKLLGAAAEDVAAMAGVEADLAELRTEWMTEPGDVWTLGPHRLACGDSRDVGLIDRLFADHGKPILMVTDPPYGVKYNPMWRSLRTPTMKNTIPLKMTKAVQNDDVADWSEAVALFPGDVAYVWHSGLKAVEAAHSLISNDFTLRSQIIWRKNTFTLGRGNYHWQHEPCWYAVRNGKTASWVATEHHATVWDVAGFVGFGYVRRTQIPEDEKSGHGTQKPLELWERPIRNHTIEGDWVYDPFLGSGTALLAADRLSRRCFAVELDPVYVALAIHRWVGRGGPEERSARSKLVSVERLAAKHLAADPDGKEVVT